VGVYNPQLDAVAGTVESDQVGSHRGATIQPQLPNALRQLGNEEVVAVELVRRNREVRVVAFPIYGEEAALDLSVFGDL
jgi:hypothetical protein